MDSKLPGVKFSVANATYEASPIDPKVIIGKAKLTAYFSADEIDTWREVIEKLNGYTVYTVKDLAATMVEVTQKKLAKTEAELEEQKRRFHAQLKSLRQKNDFLEEENKQLKQQMATLHLRATTP